MTPSLIELDFQNWCLNLKAGLSSGSERAHGAVANTVEDFPLGEQQAVLEMFTAKFLLSEEDAKRLRSLQHRRKFSGRVVDP